MKEIKEVLNKRRDILCSLIKRLHIVMMSTLPKLIYGFNINPIEIMARFFKEQTKIILKVMWKGNVYLEQLK